MIPCDALKSAVKDDKQSGLSGQKKLTPLRMHELLGIPRKVKLEPQRLKHLLASADSKKPSKDMQDETRRARTRTLEPQKLLVQMRSEGKINKPNESGREPLKPENMKDWIKSWEKSQSVKSRARVQSVGQPCISSVRRKLYSIAKSSPLKVDKSHIVEPKNVHFSSDVLYEPSDPKFNEPKVLRKSCLPPPNSIRDKYVDLCKNERTSEESRNLPTSRNDVTIIDGIEEMKNSETSSLEKVSDRTRANDADREILDVIRESGTFDETKETLVLSTTKMEKSVKFLSPNESPKNEDKKDKETKINGLTEIPRATVIMGLPPRVETREKESTNNRDVIGEISPFAISRPPLRELNMDSIRLKLDGDDTSIEDLLGNSLRNDRGESFYYENLPGKSFLEASKTSVFAKVERETLLWMHGNLKVAVQSAEEQLFTMRLVLKALEEAIKNSDDTRPTEVTSSSTMTTTTTTTVEENISSSRKCTTVSTIEIEDKTSNDDNPKFIIQPADDQVQSNEMNEETFNPDEENKENVCAKNDETEGRKSGEKCRRRSLRLASKNSEGSVSSTESFMKIEKELNIVHGDGETRKRQSINRKNDKSEVRFDPRARKSIREYMALKSTMNFLQTPDSRGLPTPKGEKDTPSHRLATRRSLSRKLLSELDDLYADSPI